MITIAYADKSEAIKNMLDEIFPGTSMKLELGVCPFCSNVVKGTDFKDALSVKEFKISGLCQKCQDGTLGEE